MVIDYISNVVSQRVRQQNKEAEVTPPVAKPTRLGWIGIPPELSDAWIEGVQWDEKPKSTYHPLHIAMQDNLNAPPTKKDTMFCNYSCNC